MIIVELILIVSLTVLSVLTLYLVLLALAYFLHRPGKGYEPCAPEMRFAVIVPAHNEAAGIGVTLKSVKSLDYPAPLYEAVVVADNCSDATAAVVRAEGMRCLERNDSAKRGKGHALDYAISLLLGEQFDAFIVLDADSVLDRNFLNVMNSRMLAGQQVIQAYDGIANPDASPLTYVFLVGNSIENRLFYEAKARLGLSVNLRGNGMCFARNVFVEHPWTAYSIVEDVEYGLRLIKEGLPISFASETAVLARQPETLEQAHTQRVRWASGSMKVSKTYAFRLMIEGLHAQDRTLFDAGLTLAALSKPLLLLLSLAAVAAALLYQGGGYERGAVYAGWALLLLGTQVAYLLTGVLLERLTARRALFLLSSPILILWFFFITVLGIARYRSSLWLRTKRV
ncbi:MAG: glycosyltransferase family 2 protein [Nitrospirota bacterium]